MYRLERVVSFGSKIVLRRACLVIFDDKATGSRKKSHNRRSGAVWWCSAGCVCGFRPQQRIATRPQKTDHGLRTGGRVDVRRRRNINDGRKPYGSDGRGGNAVHERGGVKKFLTKFLHPSIRAERTLSSCEVASQCPNHRVGLFTIKPRVASGLAGSLPP